LNSQTPLIKPERLRSLAQVTWKSFIGQMDGAVISLIISLNLASVLTICLPTYTIRLWLGKGVWLGPYLAVLLAIPFQLTGGAEVLLFSTTGQRDQFRSSIEHHVGCSQHNFLYDSSPLPTFES
jgi:uncharacterized membrane protein YraQ (UPF0718 family)